jgi:hypothetical protein
MQMLVLYPSRLRAYLPGMLAASAVLGGYALIQVHAHDASLPAHEEALLCVQNFLCVNALNSRRSQVAGKVCDRIWRLRSNVSAKTVCVNFTAGKRRERGESQGNANDRYSIPRDCERTHWHVRCLGGS